VRKVPQAPAALGPEVGVAVTKGDDAVPRTPATQQLLFGAEIEAAAEDLGYRGPTACAAAGITYRQLD
jgi:hypothetical protein